MSWVKDIERQIQQQVQLHTKNVERDTREIERKAREIERKAREIERENAEKEREVARQVREVESQVREVERQAREVERRAREKERELREIERNLVKKLKQEQETKTHEQDSSSDDDSDSGFISSMTIDGRKVPKCKKFENLGNRSFGTAMIDGQFFDVNELVSKLPDKTREHILSQSGSSLSVSSNSIVVNGVQVYP